MGFGALLTLIFVVAKLLGYFAYSWLIVFLPVIIEVTLSVLLWLLYFGGMASFAIFKNKKRKK